MASEQPRRMTAKERVSTKDADVEHQKQIREGISTAVETLNSKVSGDKEAERRKGVSDKPGGKSDQETKGISFDEITKHRQAAQQNSIDAIRGAEERYQKENEATQKQGMQRGAVYVSEKARDMKDTVVPKTQQAKDSALEKSHSAAQMIGQKAVGAKDASVEGGKQAAGYVGKVAGNVKDTAKVAGFGAAHLTLEKTAEATKGVTDAAANVAGYAGEKAVQAKDALASGAQNVAHFAGDKIAGARDVIVSTQQSAAEYAATKKEEAKNQAQAKNSEAKMEAEGPHGHRQGMQQHRGEVQQDVKGSMAYGESTQESRDMLGGMAQTMARPAENALKQVHGGQEQQQRAGGGGVLHAIGETIAEIGQTTKELLVGQGQPARYHEERNDN